ncbi:EAL domain-containing protein [Sphingomonas mali]|uniref:EAL domain-containing protein n=1 Tax=Sphingomonas mali TaxID=40682 RepID=UPI000833EBE0|nr:EAL domain-containing protein [Sphingomonas mali]
MTRVAASRSMVLTVSRGALTPIAAIAGIALVMVQAATAVRGGLNLEWWASCLFAITLVTTSHIAQRSWQSGLSADVGQPSRRPLTLLKDNIRRAIGRGEFVPFYQPLVELRDGSVIGFEALARWRHPDRGLILPDQFIGIVEDAGLMAEFGASIMRQACRDAGAWPHHLILSVNMSPAQLGGCVAARRMLDLVRATGFDPHRLIVEITENRLIEDVATARATLGVLRRAGVQVALDDFGAGFANHHIRDVEFNAIKIDRGLVQRDGALEGGNVVEAILGWRGASGLPVIAEGIETVDHAGALRDLGCDYGQGYLYGRPVPANEAWRLAWASQ